MNITNKDNSFSKKDKKVNDILPKDTTNLVKSNNTSSFNNFSNLFVERCLEKILNDKSKMSTF